MWTLLPLQSLQNSDAYHLALIRNHFLQKFGPLRISSPRINAKIKNSKSIFHSHLPQFPVIKALSPTSLPLMPVAKLCGLTSWELKVPPRWPMETPGGVLTWWGRSPSETTWVQATGSVMTPKAKSGGAPHPAWGCGLACQAEPALGAGGTRASRVLLSDLPRTSLRFINKASASVPSNHSLLLQVAVGTRELF